MLAASTSERARTRWGRRPARRGRQQPLPRALHRPRRHRPRPRRRPSRRTRSASPALRHTSRLAGVERASRARRGQSASPSVRSRVCTRHASTSADARPAASEPRPRGRARARDVGAQAARERGDRRVIEARAGEVEREQVLVAPSARASARAAGAPRLPASESRQPDARGRVRELGDGGRAELVARG